MSAADEHELKLGRLRAWLAKSGLKGVCLGRRASFAWLFAGASNAVRQDVEQGQAWALVTQDALTVLTNAIEAPRLRRELPPGIQPKLVELPWQSTEMAGAASALCDCSDNGDFGLPTRYAELAALRSDMCSDEMARWREGGKLCGQAMEEAVRSFRPGMSEMAMAGELSRSLWRREVLPAVLLVGGDQRQFDYRHAIPTPLPVEQHAMLVVCGNYRGLILSLTRIIAFGPPPAELAARQEACLHVEAAMWAASKPGASYGEVFAAARQEYARQGFPTEELRHHQGGSAGYEPRERLGGVHDLDRMAEGTPLAWNPSIQGAKSEDTVLCAADGDHEVLTLTPAWPIQSIVHEGRAFSRPAIRVL